MNSLKLQASLLLRIRVLMWAIWLVMLALLARPALAQSTYGQVVGTVTDASKSVVPGVSVTLTEVRTNVQRSTTSKADGNYEFVNVPLGQYRIDLEKSGFQKFSTQPFPLEARQTVRIDAELITGGVTTQVQVVDAAPLINTENPTIASETSNRQLQQLPFVFRTSNTSPISAIAVLPEVQKGTNFEFSLSGSLPYQNEVSVDGILTTNVRRNGIGEGAVNIFPSIESIQEIKVSSINNNAELAQVGDITTVTRGGTNQLHGAGFWNYNGNKLNADPNFFSKSVAGPPRRVNNDFGGYAGGPIFKDRTFFFGAFERLSIYGNGVGTATVPEADFRQGNFAGLSTPIVDPNTGNPFPGNIIPANRVNSVTKILLDKYIPAPNLLANQHSYTEPTSEISNQFDARIDQTFSSRHNIFGRYSLKNLDIVSPTNYQSSGPRFRAYPTRTMVISDNFVIRPNLINEGRFGFTTADIRPTTGLIGRDFVADTGLKLFSQNLPEGGGSSWVSISGYTRFGENRDEPLTSRNFEGSDNLTWIRNRHTFKGGFVIHQYNWTSPSVFTGADNFGVFNFNNNLPGGTGNAVANFLLGVPTNVDQTDVGPDIDGSAYHYGFFFQDDWRVNSTLTVNLGLRYELHPGFKDNELNITNFLRDTPNGDAVVPNEESLKLAKPDFTSGLGTSKILTAAQVGYPESLRFTDKNNFAPRFGIAWRPFGKSTVIRAGYGVFTTRMLGAIFNSLTAIHTSDNQSYDNAFVATTRTHSIVWPNTYAGTAGRGGAAVGNQNFSTANDPYFRDPYTQQWSLTVERELNRQNAVRVTYSGSHSVKLTMAPDLNQIQPNTVGYANLTRFARPYPNWARVNTRDNGGDMSYHDFTIQFKGTVLGGLTYLTSYKWAKGINNIEERGNGTTDFQTEINGRTDNRFDSRYLRGPSQAIPDHRFQTSLIWDLPFGRGKKFGADMNRGLDAIIGGWTISNITTLQTGQHLTAFYSSHCSSGTNCYGNEKADSVPGQDPNAGPKTTEEWFNKRAFSDSAFFDANRRAIFAGRFGTAGKGSIVGPGLVGIDFGAFKDFSIREGLKLRLQTQIKNLPNHTNLFNPEGNLSSSNYGKIRALQPNALPRTVLLGLRLLF
jgi:Carboxypeptidase regulatory-like domain